MSVKNKNRQRRERANAKRRSRVRARARARAQTTAAAAAARRVQDVYCTPEGAMFVRLHNGGFRNNCGPISLLQRSMVRDGVPIPAIIEATHDELAADVRDALQRIRDATVSNSHGRDIFDGHSSDINDELLSFDDLVHNASAPIVTKPMWDAIMRFSHGYFDGRAVMGGSEALYLDGLVIVKLNSDGLLEPVDGSSTPIAEAKHLIFFDGHAHFEALVSLEELLAVTDDVEEAGVAAEKCEQEGVAVE
ncbi:unnamed protein product [Pylaiella littoralis]